MYLEGMARHCHGRRGSCRIRRGRPTAYVRLAPGRRVTLSVTERDIVECAKDAGKEALEALVVST